MSDFITQEYGDLVHIEDVDMLYNSVINILNNKEKFERQKLANYAKENYSQDAVINNLIKTYESII